MKRRSFLAGLIAAPVAAKAEPAYAPVQFAGGTISCLVDDYEWRRGLTFTTAMPMPECTSGRISPELCKRPVSAKRVCTS